MTDPSPNPSRVEQVIERVRAKLRENERPGYTSYTQIFVDIEDAETIIEALSLSRIEPDVIEALRFYRDQWEQDVDAELTANGWEGTIGDIVPTQELLSDAGERARVAMESARKKGEGGK